MDAGCGMRTILATLVIGPQRVCSVCNHAQDVGYSRDKFSCVFPSVYGKLSLHSVSTSSVQPLGHMD